MSIRSRISIYARACAVFLPAALLAAAVSCAKDVPSLTPAAPVALEMPTSTIPPADEDEDEETFKCSDAPWSGNEERFVRDMLLRWRDDYARLSIGEIRVKAHEVLLGLEPPAERYAIETTKKGNIKFEREDGTIECTIERP